MYYEEGVSEVFDDLETGPDGLSSAEAEQRLEKYGRNELDTGHEINPLMIFLAQFNDVLVWILLIATAISAFLGEWVDAVAIFVILLLNAVLGYVQEYKAEKAIDELKKLAAPKASVIRDGSPRKVPAEEVVPGDMLQLQSGDKIPADGRIIEADALETQESVLTGESVPVHKEPGTVEEDARVGDRSDMVYSGTVVTKGQGKAVVTATGMETEVGQIADMLDEQEDTMTPLQEKLDTLGGRIGMATLAICAVIFAAGLLGGQGWLDMFILAVSLAVAAVPEGLPAVITIALAFGVQRMLDRNALIRNLPSVETLGSTTVICTDKTGTLTENEMTVTEVYDGRSVVDVTGSGYEPDGEVEGSVDPLLFEIGALCNDADLEENEWTVIGDPTEGALLTSARKAGVDADDLLEERPRVGSVPFDSTRKRMSTVHEADEERLMYTKGAPDVLLEHCSRIQVRGNKTRELTEEDKEEILGVNDSFTEDALRVLAFAYKEVPEQDKYTEEDESDLIFVGLQAMIDPPRDEVEESIKKCRTAGIRPIMVTGDHKKTATAIATQLGLDGRATEDVTDVGDDVSVYARVSPEDKLKLVETLQDQGEIVAMTGDGVNDAPALKQADIGISMGIQGTDVAKEASQMVLTDDNFASIVDAVEEGRGIFDNIKKFVNYLLSSNFGEVLVLFVAMLIGFTDASGEIIIPLLPLQILWMNLVTDSLPALALGVDPPEEGIMERDPRDPDEGIVTLNLGLNVAFIGVLICLATLFIFTIALPEATMARTAALTMLVVMEIVRLQMVREGYHVSFGSNPYVIWSIIGVLVLHLAAMYTPLASILELTPLSGMLWLYIILSSAVLFIVGMLGAHYIKQVTHQRD